MDALRFVSCSLFALFAAAKFSAASAQAIDHGDFSVDRNSPEVPGPSANNNQWKASDIIKYSGTGVLVDGYAISPPGIANSPYDEIDAISTGQDRLTVPGPEFRLGLDYSVGRGSVGIGGPVSTQLAVNGNAGDIFRVYFTPSGRRIGPFLYQDATRHNLIPFPPPPGPESNIDGLSAPQGIKEPIYFSISRETAAVWTNLTGQPWDAAAIYVVPMFGDPPKVYATSQQLGLQRGIGGIVGVPAVGDDIDALAISDITTPAIYNGNELIWMSLDGVSPTRPQYLLGCDGIIWISPPLVPPAPAIGGGPPLPGRVIIGPNELDLSCPPGAPYDELDAITAVDPGCKERDRRPRKPQGANFKERPECGD
jgi:hypothetical protein